jgi:hypothetical protein
MKGGLSVCIYACITHPSLLCTHTYTHTHTHTHWNLSRCCGKSSSDAAEAEALMGKGEHV